MATEFNPPRRARVVVASAVAGCALLLLGACSSRNPDTLIGMNVDENAAMMDANAAVEANLTDANGAPAKPAATNDRSEVQPANGTEKADSATAPKTAEKSRAAREVNAVDKSSATAPTLNDVEENQLSTEPDIPNAVSNY